MQTIIISGFPGIGKSFLVKRNWNYFLLDSDSSNFSWEDIDKKIRHKEWPENYINHIKKNINKVDIILVSSHDVVRESLVNNGIMFNLIYPDLSIKEEYIQRFIDRGSNESFVNLLQSNYELWINELMNQKNCEHFILQSGQYLSDVIDKLKLISVI